MKIGLLFGTETGNSEMVCEDIQEALGNGFDYELASLGDTDPTTIEGDRFYIIVTSTYGNGDLPASAVAFEDALKDQKPDLSHMRFAIFGLGDQVFSETFAHGSKRLMEMLLAQNAQMVGERGIHDASSFEMPEDIAVPWAEDIMAKVTAKAA
ncbi:MAG: flavodoxin domain-containing protein [Arenibacterium sp.]